MGAEPMLRCHGIGPLVCAGAIALACTGSCDAGSVEARLAEFSGAGSEVTVTVRDLGEEQDTPSSSNSLASHGFAVLRPALPVDEYDYEAFKRALRQGDVSGALERFIWHPDGLGQLGYGWAVCGTPLESRAAPADAPSAAAPVALGESVQGEDAPKADILMGFGMFAPLLYKLLLKFPSLVRLVKVWLPIRNPVQPLGLMDVNVLAEHSTESCAATSKMPSQRWWWHGNLSFGDALVLDAIRCPHSSFALPGETLLARAQEAARQLRRALADKGLPLHDVTQTCNELTAENIDLAPYPVVGGRYVALTTPSALVRRLENIESDVIAELRPGGVVTVLELGQEDPDRAKVYTEHATLVALEGFADGGDILGSRFAQDGVTGWLTTGGYDGKPFLQPLAAPPPEETPPVVVVRRTAEIRDVIHGICGWINATLGTTATSPQTAQGIKHQSQIRDRHVRTLDFHIEESQRVAFEVQCLAVAPLGIHGMVALGIILAALMVASSTLFGSGGWPWWW